MGSFIFFIALLSGVLRSSSVNQEVEALINFKLSLHDPNNALMSWESSNTNPCVWFHIACNGDNRVNRIDIASANLTGSLAPSLGSLQFLERLELYSNNFVGKIPEEFGNLTNLVSLDLYLNKLEGSIPATLGKLKNLQQLLLNNNSLSGTIPVELTTIKNLSKVDLSHNQLTGDVPTNGSFALLTPISFLNNKNLVLPPAASQFNFSTVSPPSQLNVKAIIGGVVAGAALVIAIPLIFLHFRKFGVKETYFDLPGAEEFHLEQLKRFSLRELQVATDYFSSRNLVGSGGFAKVYKGRLADGSLVAVKRIKEERISAAEKHFRTEVELISMAVHSNLIRLRGFCMTPTERLLVYPFMSHGSVASNLKGRPAGKPPLSWETRCRIALGTARALAYLHEHCEPRIVHRDVKADNILLNEGMEAVVADLGLARMMGGNEEHVITRACGSKGHIAPEYISTGKASGKTDVYAYGMTLLQLVTGHPTRTIIAMANPDEMEVIDWLRGKVEARRFDEFVDGDMDGEFDEEEVKTMVQTAIICMSSLPQERPSMAEVVTIFEGHVLPERLQAWLTVPTATLSRNPNSSAHFSVAAWSTYQLSGPR